MSPEWIQCPEWMLEHSKEIYLKTEDIRVCVLANSVTPYKCLAFWLTSNGINISNKV